MREGFGGEEAHGKDWDVSKCRPGKVGVGCVDV